MGITRPFENAPVPDRYSILFSVHENDVLNLVNQDAAVEELPLSLRGITAIYDHGWRASIVGARYYDSHYMLGGALAADAVDNDGAIQFTEDTTAPATNVHFVAADSSTKTSLFHVEHVEHETSEIIDPRTGKPLLKVEVELDKGKFSSGIFKHQSTTVVQSGLLFDKVIVDSRELRLGAFNPTNGASAMSLRFYIGARRDRNGKYVPRRSVFKSHNPNHSFKKLVAAGSLAIMPQTGTFAYERH